jgi:hypothetical protein
MTDSQIFYARLGSNLVALVMFVLTLRRRKHASATLSPPVHQEVARLLYVLLFLWAGCWNTYLANAHPEDYLTYAPLAYSASYRNFILGYFASHVTAIVGAIAIGQLSIAVLIATRGAGVQIGLAGAIVFLLAIVPLGVGSGFPATLIMAAGAVMLMRARFRDPLSRALRRRGGSPVPATGLQAR